MEGKAQQVIPKGYENKMHFIGHYSRPVWIGRRGDVPKLFTQEFWYVFNAWRMFNLGFGLPDEGPWTEQDTWLVERMAMFEEHYRANFSPHRSTEASLSGILGAMHGKRGR